MGYLLDASIVLLAIEASVLALIPLALVGGVVYGMFRLQRHENLPRWLRLMRAYLDLGLGYVELGMAAVVQPIFWVNTVFSTIRAWLNAISKMIGGTR